MSKPVLAVLGFTLSEDPVDFPPLWTKPREDSVAFGTEGSEIQGIGVKHYEVYGNCEKSG